MNFYRLSLLPVMMVVAVGEESSRKFSPVQRFGGFQPPSPEVPAAETSAVERSSPQLPTGFGDFMPHYEDRKRTVDSYSPGGWYYVGNSKSKFDQNTAAAENSDEDFSGGGRPLSYYTMMRLMQHMHGSQNKGILAKLTEDPMKTFLALSLPIAVVLAGVIPALMNMMVFGTAVPVLSSSATGPTSRTLDAQSLEALSPVLDAIASFGARTWENPACAQRIFCQVVQEKAGNLTDWESLFKFVDRTSSVVGRTWLRDIGAQSLVTALRSGECGEVPCNLKSKNTQKKSR